MNGSSPASSSPSLRSPPAIESRLSTLASSSVTPDASASSGRSSALRARRVRPCVCTGALAGYCYTADLTSDVSNRAIASLWEMPSASCHTFSDARFAHQAAPHDTLNSTRGNTSEEHAARTNSCWQFEHRSPGDSRLFFVEHR